MDISVPQLEDLERPQLKAALQRKLDEKTKPFGSLGRLEALALRIGLILGTEHPELVDPQLIVCAADHGLTAKGVSAYPSDVTWQMVENFLAGGAAVSVLARQHGLALNVVDCGVAHDFECGTGRARPGLIMRKVAAGTADCSEGAAMTEAQCVQAIDNGRRIVADLPGNAVLLGEMGIGNTSCASMLMSRLAGLPIAQCTGAGTGLAAEAIERKVQVLRAVLDRHADARAPLAALAAFGGFEIATLVGIVLEAARQRRVIVVDGFIATAAVLTACEMQPLAIQRCVFAHKSGERGHALMLTHLQAEPLLDLGLRLGEGSGAVLTWPLLVSACRILNEMASFASAGVSERLD
jgi:nicotinate-nucleotide--dimethylbenzimidazole phosphoribosyltransferase